MQMFVILSVKLCFYNTPGIWTQVLAHFYLVKVLSKINHFFVRYSCVFSYWQFAQLTNVIYFDATFSRFLFRCCCQPVLQSKWIPRQKSRIWKMGTARSRRLVLTAAIKLRTPFIVPSSPMMNICWKLQQFRFWGNQIPSRLICYQNIRNIILPGSTNEITKKIPTSYASSFYKSQKVLCWYKMFCTTPKDFVPAKKPILLNANHFWTSTKHFGLAQNILNWHKTFCNL